MAEKVSSISARNPLASLSEPARFALAAGAAALASLVIALQVGFQIGGEVAAETVDDGSAALVAILAALSCARAVQRSEGRPRQAWALLRASAFICVGRATL